VSGYLNSNWADRIWWIVAKVKERDVVVLSHAGVTLVGGGEKAKL
jgi:hypothetical protein